MAQDPARGDPSSVSALTAILRGKAGRLTRDELIRGLRGEYGGALFEAAHAVRRSVFGDVVRMRAIIEFSNHCRRHCAYCGINSGCRELRRYRMTPAQITDAAGVAFDAGYRTLVLQSGEDAHYTADILVAIIKSLRAMDFDITLAVGERTREDYAAFRAAGVTRYLLKHETANRGLFVKLHPDCDFTERMRCFKWLRELGYIAGGGFMVGLPGQNVSDIADDLLHLEAIGAEMAGIGPFVPCPATKLAASPPGDAELTLRAVALARLLMPRINLPVTTALSTVDLARSREALSGGANVIMLSATPADVRELYDIYPRPGRPESVSAHREATLELLTGLGLTWTDR